MNKCLARPRQGGRRIEQGVQELRGAADLLLHLQPLQCQDDRGAMFADALG